MARICPVCKSELVPEIPKMAVACDKPYFTVMLHRTCYNSIGEENLLGYVTINLGLFLDIFNGVKIRN
jgi:hypothetical protein